MGHMDHFRKWVTAAVVLCADIAVILSALRLLPSPALHVAERPLITMVLLCFVLVHGVLIMATYHLFCVVLDRFFGG